MDKQESNELRDSGGSRFWFRIPLQGTSAPVTTEQPKPITILSWTADARFEHVSHVLKIGMNGLLSKPIDRDELEKVITQIALSPSNP